MVNTTTAHRRINCKQIDEGNQMVMNAPEFKVDTGILERLIEEDEQRQLRIRAGKDADPKAMTMVNPTKTSMNFV